MNYICNKKGYYAKYYYQAKKQAVVLTISTSITGDKRYSGDKILRYFITVSAYI